MLLDFCERIYENEILSLIVSGMGSDNLDGPVLN